MELHLGNSHSTFADGDAYDLMDCGNTYGLDFYVGLAREANGPVLDVACGTSRPLTQENDEIVVKAWHGE